MAQPTPFTRSADYTDDAANAAGGRTTVDASKLDAEFDALVTTLSGVLTNLALNQRDDGEIRDGRVKIHTLGADVLSLLTTLGITVRGAWLTATAYAVKDIVTEDGATYICAEAHTSGTFSTDLTAVKWVLIANAPDAFAASSISVTPAGNISATDAQAALEELDSEKLSASGNLAAVADAATALSNLGGVPLDGGTMTGLLTLSGAPTSALHAATKAYADANIAGLSFGQCYFEYVSTTQCRLSRYNGNKLFINGAWREIPSAGVTLSNSGLSASTFYYVYAYMDGANIALKASATGRATDSTHGHQIKNGDSSRTLVGALYTSGASEFQQSGTVIYVLSWFNKRARYVDASPSSDQSTSSTTPWVNVTNGATFWLNWTDFPALIHFHARLGNTTDGAASWVGIGDEGDNSSIGALGGDAADTNGDVSSAGTTYRNVSEGTARVARLRFYCSAGTVTIKTVSRVTVQIWG